MNSCRPGSISMFIAAKRLHAAARADRLARCSRRCSSIGADSAAEHRVGVAAAHAASRRSASCGLRIASFAIGRRDALAPHQLVVLAASVFDSADRLRMLTTSKSAPGLRRRPSFSMRCSITSARPIRTGWAMPSSTHDLHGAQHALVLAFGKDDALAARAWPPRTPASCWCRSGRRSAPAARDRRRGPRSAASRRRCPSRPWRRPARSARSGAGRTASGSGSRGRSSSPGRRRRWRRCRTARLVASSAMRVHGGELHLLVDRRRADVERAAEDEREAQHVVDLVRIVRAAGAR